MKLKFSRHAKRQMKWRIITEEEVKMALSNPDRLEDAIKDRKNAFKRSGDKLLKITYKHEGDDIIVITAMVKGGS